MQDFPWVRHPHDEPITDQREGQLVDLTARMITGNGNRGSFNITGRCRSDSRLTRMAAFKITFGTPQSRVMPIC
jgi:hypothetical protein